MKKAIVFLIIIAGSAHLIAQEVVKGLQFNATLQQQSNKAEYSLRAEQRLTLPFFEDFRTEGVYPSPQRWVDKQAFVNVNGAINPPNAGVATLDALNEKGAIYTWANFSQFASDTLMSQTIRLDSVFAPVNKKLQAADSIYLSFYYQPQGLGNAPEESDSLVLKFWAPNQQKWYSIWQSSGMSYDSFNTLYGEDFHQVMLAITDTAFLQKDFRFMLMNYASLAGSTTPDWQSNADFWHIDYIKLDMNRTKLNPFHHDITFVDPAPTLLKNYQAMPMKQYQANTVNSIKTHLNVKISNLDKDPYTASYHYTLRNEQGDSLKAFVGGSYSIAPFTTSGYVNYSNFSNPPVTVLYPYSEKEEITYTIEHILRSDELSGGEILGDTIINKQTFSNYYAYDDGVADAGYGLSHSGGMLAYKFQLNTPDSLQAIQFFFNQTLIPLNNAYFKLTVWNNISNQPGEVIYQKGGYLPEYEDELNQFHHYALDNAIYISPENFPGNIFYIGWEQITDDFLNIGLDFNNKANQYTYYNANGTWYPSVIEGALMIRPVLGKKGVIGIKERNESVVNCYPNPIQSGTVLHLSTPNKQPYSQFSCTLYNAAGVIVLNTVSQNDITIPEIVSGLYFLRITNETHTIIETKKIIVQ